MAILCVSYDLHAATEEDYKPLIEHLKTNYKTWWHHLESTWFIKTDLSTEDVLKRCVESVTGKGTIIVFDVGNMWAASGFKDRAYQWLWKNWPED